MEFKTTIEFLEFLKEVDFTYGGKSYDMEKNINEVIQSVKQGEAYRQIVEKWWDEMSYIKKSTIIKGGEHLCVPERSQNYEEFWDDLTPDEKIKVFDEYKNI